MDQKIKCTSLKEIMEMPKKGLPYLEYIFANSDRSMVGGRVGKENVWWDLYYGKYYLIIEDDLGNVLDYPVEPTPEDSLRILEHMSEKRWVTREYIHDMLIMLAQIRLHSEKNGGKNE